MEFEGQYLSYKEYQDLGGTLEETPFNLLEYESRRKIDIRTQNRLIDCENIPQEVKLCVFKMINSMENYTASTNILANSSNIKSESTDGYSISYMTASDVSNILKSKSEELDDIIKSYLTGVIANGEHIMFLGIE